MAWWVCMVWCDMVLDNIVEYHIFRYYVSMVTVCLSSVYYDWYWEPSERRHLLPGNLWDERKTETVLKSESAEPSRHMADILSYCSAPPAFSLILLFRFPFPLNSDLNGLGWMTRCYVTWQESSHSSKETQRNHLLHCHRGCSGTMKTPCARLIRRFNVPNWEIH